MSDNKINIEQLKERLKAYLPHYLIQMGLDVSKRFRCINPEHPDHHPDCGVFTTPDGYPAFHCFACGVSGDIFTAASLVEGKPMSGRGFITENVLYLAQRMGEEIPEGIPELTEEEIQRMDISRAYVHASMIVRGSQLSERVRDRLAELRWDDKLRHKMQIGGVQSYDDYIHRMRSIYRYTEDFLEKIDLTNRRIFNENCLIFTLKDVNGAPVGFAARDLLYAQKKQAYDKAVLEIQGSGMPADVERAELKKLFKPVKFVNTSGDCPIFHKGELLYNFDQAARFTPPMWVMEGYADAATAVGGGLPNTVAVASTTFTEEMLRLVLDKKIRHIIFVLDGDDAGENGTERFVKMLEAELGGYVGLKVEIVTMPEGSDDPDSYIRSYGKFTDGVTALRNLPRTDLFSWKLKRAISQGAEALTLAESTMPLIVNEANNLLRLGMVQKLAEVTHLDEIYLRRELTRLLDEEASRLAIDRQQISNRLVRELGKHPEAAFSLIEQARQAMESIEGRKVGYDQQMMIKHAEYLFDRNERADRPPRILTGWHEFDRLVRGFLREECFVTVPGKPNVMKSSFLGNLAWRIPENNRDVRMFVHTVDDSWMAFGARIIASRFDMPIDWVKEPTEFENQVEDFAKRYHDGKQWLLNMMEEEKLLMEDVTGLAKTVPALSLYLRSLRRRFPHDTLFVLCDNLSKYELPGYDHADQSTYRKMSDMFKEMTTTYACTIVGTCELPKESLRPGVRPRMGKIKNTGGMAYDSNLNVGVYNDMKDYGNEATLVWDGPNEAVLAPGGVEMLQPKRMPIIELVIDKSKICSFDGTLYYRGNPETARFDECGPSEQMRYRGLAEKEMRKSDREIASSSAPHRSL